MARSDRGQATLALLAGALVVLVLALGLAEVGRAAVDAARARTAADAAALAGARAGVDVARAVAADNGARLERFDRVGGDVVVRVRVGRSVATARAGPTGG